MGKEKTIVLNEGQKAALDKIMAFIRDDSGPRVFILKGYAGTGKTTMINKVISFLETRNINYGLLASTGRAAKILGDVTGRSANTIHSEIYRFHGLRKENGAASGGSFTEDDAQLVIQFDLGSPDEDSPSVYVVDEASMISDKAETSVVQSRFGDGRLLNDLLRYNVNAKFIFVGDPSQLPPVAGDSSPALSAEYLKKTFGIDAGEATLTEVMRQSDGNGIVETSALVRGLCASAPENELFYGGRNSWLRLPFRHVNGIELVDAVDTLLAKYIQDIRNREYTKSVFICMSNSACYKFSSVIRNVLGFKGPLEKDELLLVVQNNLISGFRNGDMVQVVNVSPVTELRGGITFREIEVKELFTGKTYKQLMMDDILYQPQANLSQKQQSKLYGDFIMRMKAKNISEGNPAFEDFMRSDKYLNALRVSFGYAVTCHKAQGGEWERVYAYFPRNIMLNPTKQKYQWVYTAMTRAKEKLFVIDDIYIEGYRKY